MRALQIPATLTRTDRIEINRRSGLVTKRCLLPTRYVRNINGSRFIREGYDGLPLAFAYPQFLRGVISLGWGPPTGLSMVYGTLGFKENGAAADGVYSNKQVNSNQSSRRNSILKETFDEIPYAA